MYNNRIPRLIFWLAVIMLFTICVIFLQYMPQQDDDLEMARYEAQQAQAELQKVQTQLDLVQAKADLTRAQGEKAILESAARSIDSDRQLTEYYAHRADTRAILFFVGLVGTLACMAGFVLVMNRRSEHDKAQNTNT